MSTQSGLLVRLLNDRAGSTLAIAAAAMIPFVAIAGSGIDISRAYLTKTRMQQACDAGVLAGRKMMGSGGSVNTAVTNEVRNYVNFNFPQNSIDSTSFTITPTLGADDTVELTLSTQVNTAVMKIFGKNTLPVSVSCSARNDYSNIDIVLVLDTTGSMACAPERDGNDCSNWINGAWPYNTARYGKTTTINGRTVTYVQEETSGGANISRIQGLRDASAALKAQMASIEAQFATASAGTRKRVRYSVIPFSQMVNAGFSLDGAGATLYSRHNNWFNTSDQYWDYSCGRRGCSASLNTVSHNNSWMNNTWDGCVEEQQTSNLITASTSYSIPGNLPSNTIDLTPDANPSITANRWTVADPVAAGDSQYACPKAMRELQEMDSSAFNNYFTASTGFLANGGTYLDLGMLWAARILSRTGNWSDQNPMTYNSWPFQRYVILMTDGQMDTGNSGYGAYAQEYWARRITTNGSATTSNENHSERLNMLCTAIKNMDVKIFALSFSAGSALSSDLTNCSSGTGYAIKADNSAALTQAFKDIGNTIGALRLSR